MGQEQIKTISGSIYDTYTTASQEYKENRMPRVGQKCEFEDGSKYVFCSTAVDVAAGQVVAAPTVLEETAPAAIAAAGVYQISIIEASVTANLWKEGYVVIVLGTGVGYRYRIKSNTASATVATVDNTVYINLYDPLCVALAITDDVTVIPYRPSQVIIGVADNDGIGVAQGASTAATSGVTNYFWAQTAGVAYGLTCTAAKGLGIMQAAAGALAVVDATGGQVGKSIEPGATNGVVNLSFPCA